MAYSKPMVTIELAEYQELTKPKDENEVYDVHNKFMWCIVFAQGNVLEAARLMKERFKIAVSLKNLTALTGTLEMAVKEQSLYYQKLQ